MKLTAVPGIFAVSRINPGEAIPKWATDSEFFSINKTDGELSVVCEEAKVPEDIQSEKNWKLFKVEGPLGFGLTGILDSIAHPLAQARISIFAISTYDTDYVMVKSSDFDSARKALQNSGITISSAMPTR